MPVNGLVEKPEGSSSSLTSSHYWPRMVAVLRTQEVQSLILGLQDGHTILFVGSHS